jgi:hypothetical protein
MGMLPSEDPGDLFPSHFLESNAGMNGYYNQAARAMHYRSSHGKWSFPDLYPKDLTAKYPFQKSQKGIFSLTFFYRT